MINMTLPKEKIYVGNLLLMNADFPFQSPSVEELMPADTKFPDILMKRGVANVLKLILKKIDCSDEIVPVIGYCSASNQTKIYENSLRDSGEGFTAKFVAPPHYGFIVTLWRCSNE